MAKCICPNCNMYLSKLQNVFVEIVKYICPHVLVESCDKGKADRWQARLWLMIKHCWEMARPWMWTSNFAKQQSIIGVKTKILLQVTAIGEIKHAASGHCLDQDANNENQVSCSHVEIFYKTQCSTCLLMMVKDDDVCHRWNCTVALVWPGRSGT